MGRITIGHAVVAYLGLVAVMSLWTFVVYGFDKRRAARGGRRVAEQTLHLLALVGGWPGALFGQRFFRHKTSKLSFLVVFWAVVVIHNAIVGTAAYALFTSRSGALASLTHDRSSTEKNVRSISMQRRSQIDCPPAQRAA